MIQCSGMATGSYLKLIYGGSISPKFNTFFKKNSTCKCSNCQIELLKHYVKFLTFHFLINDTIVFILKKPGYDRIQCAFAH